MPTPWSTRSSVSCRPLLWKILQFSKSPISRRRCAKSSLHCSPRAGGDDEASIVYEARKGTCLEVPVVPITGLMHCGKGRLVSGLAALLPKVLDQARQILIVRNDQSQLLCIFQGHGDFSRSTLQAYKRRQRVAVVRVSAEAFL